MTKMVGILCSVRSRHNCAESFCEREAEATCRYCEGEYCGSHMASARMCLACEDEGVDVSD